MLIVRVSPISYPLTTKKKLQCLCTVISVTQVCKFETPALQQGFGKSTVLICVTSLWRYPPYFNYVKQFWCSSLAIYAWELSISVRFKHQWALHAHGVSCLKSGGWFFTLATLPHTWDSLRKGTPLTKGTASSKKKAIRKCRWSKFEHMYTELQCVENFCEWKILWHPGEPRNNEN